MESDEALAKKRVRNLAKELKKFASKVWKVISSEHFKNPCEFMPKHMQEVIDDEGSHTKY